MGVLEIALVAFIALNAGIGVTSLFTVRRRD